MRFKPGQKIVCIKEGEWRDRKGDLFPFPCPKYGDIVTVLSPCPFYADSIRLSEYGNSYSFTERRFAPLMDISELTEILEQQPEEAPCHN